MPATTGVAVTVISALGVVAIFFALFGLVLSGIQQAARQRSLHADLREDLALGTAPLGGSIAPGTPIAMIEGKGLGPWVVVEGTSSGILRAGPGHRRDTVLPGQVGVSVLYGRSVTYGAPFNAIGLLSEGDVLRATTGQGTFSYRVEGLRQGGDPLPAPLPIGGSRLTLVTAVSDGARRGWTAESMLFVDATLQGTGLPAPPGRPAGVTEQEKAMAADSSELVALVLWLQALVLVVVGSAWARVRWGFWQAWLTGVPPVLAVAWGCADTTFGLVPNLL